MAPVTVNASDTTFAAAAYPNQNFCGLDHMTIDNRPRMQSRCVGLVKFALPDLPEGSVLSRAVLNLFIGQSGCVSPLRLARRLLVYKNLSDFSACTAVWTNRPVTADEPSCDIGVTPAAERRYASCDITPLARQWIEGGPNCGVSLETPASASAGPVFIGSECSAHPPLLQLTFQPQPPIPGDALIKPIFKDSTYALTGSDPFLFTTPVETAGAAEITFFIQNLGTQPVTAALQISPDGQAFMEEAQRVAVKSGALEALCPYRFARFTRAVVSNSSLTDADVKVWAQTQTLGYRLHYQS